MVYENVVKQQIGDPAYENEHFRAKYHYKEAHVHDPPYRRNRDFKPVNYGSFRGILNFKHSEPWALLKNLNGMQYEHANHPWKWTKAFLYGAFVGTCTGYTWFVVKPVQTFPMKKLFSVAGDRPWSGRTFRYVKNIVGPYAFIGGSMALSYQLIFDFLRHHEETNIERPLYFDHMLACTIIGSVFLGLWKFYPRFWFTGGFIGGFLVAPMTFWAYKHARFNVVGRAAPNIFYENSVTKEEIERIQALDFQEALGQKMLQEPGFGYYKKDPRFV